MPWCGDVYCIDCQYRENVFLPKMSDKNPKCPDCGKEMERLIGPTRTTFKFADKSGMKRG